MGKEGSKLDEELRKLVDNYLGNTPQGVDCKSWKEMQEKMVEEIKKVADPYTQIANKLGLVEVRKPFNMWRDKNGVYYKLTAYGFQKYRQQSS